MEIILKDLVKEYGDVVAVDVPHLEIPEGQVVGLVGNNGAGKTTMLRLVLDLVQATKGHVSLGGERVDKTTGWKSHTGSYLDEGFLIDFLNAEEYFSFVGKAYGMSLEEIEAGEPRYANLFTEEVLGTGKLIRDLSAGNRKKVGLLAALLVKPSVLVLDECGPVDKQLSVGGYALSECRKAFFGVSRQVDRNGKIGSGHCLSG